MKYKPMLAVKGNESVLFSNEYIFEPKMDGTRCISEIGKEINLFNRRGKNITKRYPEVVEELKKFDNCIVDGEIICYNNGKPDFYRLQQREHVENDFMIEIRAKLMPATYVIFDVLERNGKKLINIPLIERKKILKDLVKEGEHIQLIFYTYDGKKLWDEIKKFSLEGVMAKNRKSLYYPGERRKEWVKIKNLHSIDVVIVGYTSEKRGISAMGMGLYKNGELTYIGKVGTGFDNKMIEMIQKKLIKVDKPCVKNYKAAPEKMIWIKPNLVAEVEYLEVTEENELRSPSFKRFRNDKLPEECKFEQLK